MINNKNKIFGLKTDFYSQSAIFCLVIIILIGLCSNWIATSRPLYYKLESKTYFPAFSKQVDHDLVIIHPGPIDWVNYRSSTEIIFAPVPYDPGRSDVANANYRPPFAENLGVDKKSKFRHWLGTNLKGDDLLSGLIHGTSVSLKIGFFAILIALFIGTLFGIISGYYQNDTLRVPLLSFLFMLFSIIPSLFYANLFSFFVADLFGWENTGLFMGTIIIYLLIILIGILITYWFGKFIHLIFRLKRKIYFPIDIIISRLIEIFAAIPRLMLIVALAAILTRGVNNVIIIIGISSWAGIARLIRAETLKLRNQDFITSAKALGLSNFKIMYKHVLPNISGPIMVTFVFGMSAAILIESGLSFLNIGVPEDVITWGQLLADGRHNFNAWWLIAFPGFAIFITVLCLNVLGEKFTSLLDPVNRGIT